LKKWFLLKPIFDCQCVTNKKIVNFDFFRWTQLVIGYWLLKKEEKQAREECFRPQQAAAARANSPSVFRRGAGRRGSNIKISEFLVKK